MSLKIRQAVVEDAKVISNIHALSWKSAYKELVPQRYLDDLKNDFWVEAFENWIRSDDLKAKIIYENEKPIGCAIYGKSRDEKLLNWGEIVSIYLLPDYFHKGYGQKLLDNVLIDMKELGYKNIYLWVLEENDKARLFYEKNGFKCNDDKYYFEVMQKQLVNVRYVNSLKSLGNKNPVKRGT
ncbi:GNAT family N-acetyltransferase [Clostridium cylindrosporum]|uniref:Acetyltransferase, N-acetylglutamate synthase n=1 Tax=Clostridium cylindrosporum DSM 605 TaxID=1121307 RepID=A0A0J8D9C9_CLOCY|nr:GNAT family N-acetyltransferase [Clostridium cylindrosporum]KMT22462.1 acetyltransferase, N-acetylglutamate synthase [Clostridium cylindrosporum DSM 605]